MPNKIEKTVIQIECEQTLLLIEATAVRGFFGNLYRKRPEFHGHQGNKFVYKHPMIQYKIINGKAIIIGIKEGAYLLKAVPRLEYLEIYHQKYPIVKQDTSTNVVPFGSTKNMISYSFATPWIGLNERNYEIYLTLRKKPKDALASLERIIVGNILSMSKSVGYVVKDEIQVKAKTKESGTIEVKDGIRLMAFRGEFEINFLIPNSWGIGKFSSRGYGTVRCNSGGRLNDQIY